MKSSYLLLITIAVILGLFFNNAHASSISPDKLSFPTSIEKICEMVADVTHKPNLTSVCVSILQGNGSSLVADIEDLALKATNLMIDDFNDVIKKIEELLHINPTADAGIIGALNTCYSEVKDSVAQLEAAYNAYEANNYLAALFDLYQANKDFQKCKGALSGYVHLDDQEKLGELLQEFSVVDDTSTIAIGLAILVKGAN